MGQRGEAMNSRARRPLPRNKIVSRRLRNLLWMGLGLALFSLAVRYLDDNLYGSSSFSGWFLTASIVVLAAFHWRKKVPVLAVLGSAAGWMQFHIYLGLSTFVLFGWHVHWTLPGGKLEQALALAYLLVAGSGVYGLYLTRATPRRLAAIQRQFIYEQIPLLRREVSRRARSLVLTEAGGNEILARVYVNRVADFLEGTRGWWFAWWPSGNSCRKLISELVSLDRYLAPPQRETSRQLMGLIREKDDLDYHAALQGRLKGWLFLHVAMTYSLLTLMIVHIVLVYAFAGGGR
jgi:hypothetical protein